MKSLARYIGIFLSTGLATALITTPLQAQTTGTPATHSYGLADTAFVATCGLFVMLMMLPGLGLFYGGMARAKNVLSVLTQVLAASLVTILLWTVIGYSLAFDPGPFQPVLGGLHKILLHGVTSESTTGRLPEYLYYFFMALFAAITPPIIVGAFAERMRFSAVLIFLSVWFMLDYVPLAHMAWGGGWISKLGVLDFAGGNVVHLNSGVAALVAAIMLGRRKGLGTTSMAPHDLTITYSGGCMLFVGWLAFCGGCDYSVSGYAILLIINTMLGGVGGGLGWMFLEWRLHRRPSTFGIISGIIAGLVGITPACGYCSPGGAILVGIITAMICLWMVDNLKRIFSYDDAFDVFGIHGIGAFVGGVLSCVFAAPALGGSGFLHGRNFIAQLGVQLLAMAFSILVAALCTVIGMTIARLTVGLRVDEEEELTGVDLTSHGETAYRFDTISGDGHSLFH